MKALSAGLLRRIGMPLVLLCASLLGAAGQTRPSLTLQFAAGSPTMTLSGVADVVYCIQYRDGLSSANPWTDRTLLKAQVGGTVWADPSAPTPPQRFYRAVSVPQPTDPRLVFVQPGTFIMGSPTTEAYRSSEPQHSVTISRGFWMGKYLVTQADYLALVGKNPSYYTPSNGFPSDLTCPVERVSWSDATNYCAMLTQQQRTAGLIPANWAYRLPTESEWEYAARAGTTTAFYLGSGLYSGQANFNGQQEYDATLGTIYNPGGIWLSRTTPVGSYAPNPWGLYDMIGNLYEWTQDLFGNYPYGSVVDPQGGTSSYRAFRGGYCNGPGHYCRSAARGFSLNNGANASIGFRVVLAQVVP